MFIASDEFVDAAEKQSQSLGLPEVRRFFVPHPIQDQTDEEMRTRAEAAFVEILDTLMRPV